MLPARWWGQVLQTARRHGPNVFRRLAPELSAVESGRTGINEVGVGLENHFLQVGSNLEQLATLSDGILTAGENLIRLATGQTDGDHHLHGAIDVLYPPVRVLDECLNRSAAVISRLCEHQALITDIRRLESLMDDIVAPLRFIQVSFRIESAVLDPEARGVFVGLTHEIEQLYQQVVGLFAEQFTSLANAHRQIDALVTRLGPQIKAHQQLVDRKKALIEKTLDDLRHALEENQNQDVRLVGAAHSLKAAVAKVVNAVQFQDITRQKLQHVDEALTGIRERINDPAFGQGRRRGDAAAELGSFINEVGAVQLAQIASVQKELRDAEQSIGDAFSSILHHAGQVDEECVLLRNFKTSSVEVDGMVQVILNTLDDLTGLVNDTLIIQSEVSATLTPLAGMASNLTGTMSRLSQSIRLIALNAQIQAAQVGMGTGLEVLAQRTCNLADEATNANGRAAEGLDRLIAGFDALGAECKSLEDSVGGQQRWLEVEGSSVKTRLHRYRDRTLESFSELGNMVETTRKMAQTALDGLPFSATTCSQLDPLVSAIEALIERTAELHLPAPGRHDAGAVPLHSNYTMASEREVHLAVLAQRGSRPAVNGAEAEAPAELPTGPGLLAAEPSPVVATAETSKAPAAAPGLGDNVELF